jgi:hypothetical protein
LFLGAVVPWWFNRSAKRQRNLPDAPEGDTGQPPANKSADGSDQALPPADTMKALGLEPKAQEDLVRINN